jgi:thiol:disulfide interchange protein
MYMFGSEWMSPMDADLDPDCCVSLPPRSTRRAWLSLAGCSLASAALSGCDSWVVPIKPSAAVPTKAANTEPVVFALDHNSAIARAERTGQPVLLFFTAEWCKYCHQLADEVLSRPEIQGLARSFQCIQIDADAQPELCKQYGVTGFPTLICLGPQGQLTARLVGKQSPAVVQTTLQVVLRTPVQARSVIPERR